jgi:secreted trypsin-like serine protease
VRTFVATILGVLALAAPAQAVVGGHPVAPGQFRYVANVHIAGAFGCTGTLIAPQWVLTAGHCGSATGSLSMGLAPSPAAWPTSAYEVVLGTVYADGHDGETHAVSQVLVDSDYIVTNGTGNDVTLMKLDGPSKIAPMAIAAVGERAAWKPGAMSTIAGFGLTSQDASNAPDQMQAAQVPITTDDYCAQAYPGGLSTAAADGSFDPKTMVCAGYPEGGTDTCEGDSGGPLLAPVSATAFRLVAATSFGNGCAQPGKPGVYASRRPRSPRPRSRRPRKRRSALPVAAREVERALMANVHTHVLDPAVAHLVSDPERHFELDRAVRRLSRHPHQRDDALAGGLHFFYPPADFAV